MERRRWRDVSQRGRGFAGRDEAAAEEAPIIRLVNGILREAVQARASDVHMEPYEKEYRVRSSVWTACWKSS